MPEAAASTGFRHVALLYKSPAEYLAAVRAYVEDGLARCEPVFLAVAPRPEIHRLRNLANPAVCLAVMTDLGRNPARIIPAVRAFVDNHAGQRVRYLSELAWPSRSAAELREAARLEALLNQAFAGVPATMLCPYDAAGLPRSVIAGARHTHPAVVSSGRERASRSYLGPRSLPDGRGRPLPRPPANAQTLTYETDLRPVRAMVTAAARRAGLAAGRATDLALAISELAANTLRHTTKGGKASVWYTEREVVCQVQDSGFIADPLAGLLRPADDRSGGQGLWLVNQVCDLVELRTSQAGTTIRLHMWSG